MKKHGFETIPLWLQSSMLTNYFKTDDGAKKLYGNVRKHKKVLEYLTIAMSFTNFIFRGEIMNGIWSIEIDKCKNRIINRLC